MGSTGANPGVFFDSSYQRSEYKVLNKAVLSTAPTLLRIWRNYASSVVLAVLFLIITLIFKRLKDKDKNSANISKNPIPKSITSCPSLPFIGPLHQIFWNRNNMPEMLEHWNVRYGDILRARFIGMDIIFLSNPPLIQKLLTSTSHLEKAGHFYRMFTGVFQFGLPSVAASTWKPHRSIMAEGFKYESLQGHALIANFYAKQLVANLLSNVNNLDGGEGTVVNLNQYFYDSSLQVILHVITGSDLIAFESAETQSFVKNYERHKEILMHRINQPWLLAEPIWRLHPLSRELAVVVKKLQRFVTVLMRKFRDLKEAASFGQVKTSPVSSSKGLIDIMVEGGYSDDDIFMEIMSFIIAGHDTVGMSLTILMYNLALNPEHQAICREEIDQMFAESKGAPSMYALGNLKYLDRCIKESLRLHPILPIFGRQLTTPLKLDDNTELGTGVSVFVLPWMVHRNPTLYPQPHRYNPNRFLPENCKTRHNYAYIPFSAGYRNCIGWKMAMLEMKITAAYILRQFEIHPTEMLKTAKFRFSLTLTTEEDLLYIVKKREDVSINL